VKRIFSVLPKTVTREAVIRCIECGVKSRYRGQIALGTKVTCPECETWMQVVSLDPVQVDWIYEEPEYDDDQEGR
jgi:hypothetical protein